MNILQFSVVFALIIIAVIVFRALLANKSKTISIIPIIVAVVFITVTIIYGIGVNHNSIDNKELKTYFNNSYSDYKNVELKNRLEIGDKTIAIFLSDNNYIGGGVFFKDIFGKLRHDIMGHGNNLLYRSYIFKHDNSFYWALLGKNNDKISYALANIEKWDKQLNVSYSDIKIDISDDEYFIVVKELDNNYSYKTLTPNPVSFYDTNGNYLSKLMSIGQNNYLTTNEVIQIVKDNLESELLWTKHITSSNYDPLRKDNLPEHDNFLVNILEISKGYGDIVRQYLLDELIRITENNFKARTIKVLYMKTLGIQEDNKYDVELSNSDFISKYTFN